MTPENAFKLRAGDHVQRPGPPFDAGTVKGRHGHLIYIEWDSGHRQHRLTYDCQDLERYKPEDP